MPVADYCEKNAVLFLKSTDKENAFNELSSLFSSLYPSSGMSASDVFKKMMERETLISTWISHGIAVPHVIAESVSPSRIILGISRSGIPYAAPDGEPVHLLVFIVGELSEHLEVLRQAALRLSLPSVYKSIVEAHNAEEAWLAFTGEAASPVQEKAKIDPSFSCLKHAFSMAEEIGVERIFVHADCLNNLDILTQKEFDSRKTIFITISKYDELSRLFPAEKIIQIPFKGITRANQIELSVIFAISRGIAQRAERIISVVGQPYSGILDTVQVTEVSREFGIFLSLEGESSLNNLERQVLVRAIEIAGELAEEGREGKPSGCIFVLGDYEQVRRHCQQMIINPFKGYADGELNILDPSLKETVKELSKIDGAFIIQGDGRLLSAGTYIRTRTPLAELPSGLGARHAAAAAITIVSRAVAIALSESTRKLSVFKNGKKIMEL